MEQFTQGLRDFYQKLQDDESRFVFKEKLLYFLDGDEEHNRKVVREKCEIDDIRKELDELREFQNNGMSIIFYGAGVIASRMKYFLELQNITADAFCDRDTSKNNRNYLGLPVISLEELTEEYKDAVIIITTSIAYSKEIKHNLKELGFPFVYDIFRNHQTLYFHHSFIGLPQRAEIYINCGAYDAKTIEEFASFANNEHEKIYAFEPDSINYARSLAYLTEQNIQRVKLIKKGAWSEITSIPFTDTGDSGSHICDDGTVKVPVTTIDEVVGDDKITFITMDIEGAELGALKGAKRTISRCKPRLAICLYHKPEDILELPLYIQSLVSEYVFYLRPHMPNSGRYVLYAV